MSATLPSILDLFCGCGGFALGFKKVGFPLLACVDSNPAAVKTFQCNFTSIEDSSRIFKCADISEFVLTEENVFLKVGFGVDVEDGNLIVVGGPPCQAYSRAGRGKLSSLGADRHHTVDPRGSLYEDFINTAIHLNAQCIVMENVPDSISYGGENIPERVCEKLEEVGYTPGWSILNAADFGVPQVRERVILIAYRSDLDITPAWPEPTHYPVKMAGILRHQIKGIRKSSRYFREPHGWDDAFSPWVTVNDAISDLPQLRKYSTEQYLENWMNAEIPYKTAPANKYQLIMRAGTTDWEGTTAHLYRNTPRDFPIFERMKPNDNFLAASQIADDILEERSTEMGISFENNPELFQNIKKKIVPPYDRTKFDDKWLKLDPDCPSRTVVAHLGVDTYSHIHPFEPRGISIREAARLQSFPDDFQFTGSMGDAYTQIGNAVPPLLAQAIAKVISNQLTKKENKCNF